MSAIGNSSLYEMVYNGHIPTMISFTSLSGNVIPATNGDDGGIYPTWKLFDKQIDSSSYPSRISSSNNIPWGGYVEYQFENEIHPYLFYFRQGFQTSIQTQKMSLTASADGIAYEKIKTNFDVNYSESISNVETRIPLIVNKKYKYFRFYFLSGSYKIPAPDECDIYFRN